jgi:membrane-bound ClpP family serine protease
MGDAGHSEKKKPDKSVVMRYSAYQLPGLIIVVILLLLLRQWFGLSLAAFAAIVAAWVAKDVVIFFYVWPAYDRRDRPVAGKLIGETGVAVDEIDPDGYVRIGGERWQACSRSAPIGKGEPVRVIASEGIRLIIEKEEK